MRHATRRAPFTTTTCILVAAAAWLLPACSGLYYDSMEKLGWHKRDLLVSRVQDARDEQQEAKEEFQTALEKFTDVVGFEGGDLETNYKRFNDQFERCERQAGKVRDRIESIESVSTALFEEWDSELETYSSQDLRRRSEQQLAETRARYDQLIGAMHRAEQKMEPVLVAFGDQVMSLKHNLNAQAIASLQGDVVSLESDVGNLIAEMEAAIAEANSFIQAMGPA